MIHDSLSWGLSNIEHNRPHQLRRGYLLMCCRHAQKVHYVSLLAQCIRERLSFRNRWLTDIERRNYP